MYISYSWLQENVKLPKHITPQQVADKLKLSTVEVEDVQYQGAGLAGIVVGKVTALDKHPNADKLTLCTVDVGKEKLQIVCGGSNLRKDMLVAVATLGSKVQWHGEGELIEMKEAEIRGVKSFGMISASNEIGLGEMFPAEDRMILDLTTIAPKAKPGTPVADALSLNDIIFEVDNKSLSNRPDLWGHVGLAREVGALFGGALTVHKSPAIKTGKGWTLKVDVKEKKLSPRYMGVVVDGVEAGESPAWLKQRLTSVGVHSINAIVDIANFVMLELGQPMHAFDAEKISQNAKVKTQKNIVVRNAKEGEVFVALDGKEMVLSPDALVIADENRVLALAGIKGGKDSGVTAETKTVIFESANFDPISIRKTSTKYGLRTDASSRYEKSLDPNLCEQALARAVELVLQICPNAHVVSSVSDVSHFHLATGPMEVGYDFIEQRIGTEIPKKEVKEILERLGFGMKDKKDALLVTIPTWRATKDISIPEDVVEEVVRIFGYDRLPSALPSFSIVPPRPDVLRHLSRQIRDVLAYECGVTEVYNYSFVSPSSMLPLGMATQEHVELENPLAKDRPFLRRSLLPNLLENLESNLHRFESVSLFEIGRVYEKDEPGDRQDAKGDVLLPRQDTHLTVVVSAKQHDTPFTSVSGMFETLRMRLGLPAATLVQSATPDQPYVHPYRSASIGIGPVTIGTVYEITPSLSKDFGIPYRVGVLTLNLSKLSEIQKDGSNYVALTEYPSVSRDIAFVVESAAQHAALTEAIVSVDPLITDVELFDVYTGSHAGEGNKSMAYHITYTANDRTLTSQEIDTVHARVINMLHTQFGAEVR